MRSATTLLRSSKATVSTSNTRRFRNRLRGVECSTCGVWYLDPRPAAEDFSQIYPDDYAAYEMEEQAEAARSIAFRAKSRLEAIKIREYERYAGALPGQVLDVGCGDGSLLDGFRRAGVSAETLEGVDFHPAAIERARSKGYRILEGVIERVPLEPERYRLIVMNQLIEHVVEPVEVLRRLHTSLVPGGVVFLETPNTASLNARLAPRAYWGGYHYPRHLHLFSPETMRQALEQAGLELVQVRYVPCPVQWVLTINNWLKGQKRPWPLALRLTDWRNPLWLAAFTALDLLFMTFGAGTANMQIVARRPA